MQSIFVVELDCYLGGLSSTSQAPVAANTQQSWTMAAGASLPMPGMLCTIIQTANPTSYSEGICLTVVGQVVTLFVTLRSGLTGVCAAWQMTTARANFSTHEFITLLGETPANRRFEPCIQQAGDIGRYMFDNGGTGGASRTEIGDIILANADGRLDRLLDYGIGGRDLTVRVADIDELRKIRPSYPFGFTTVLVGTALQPSADYRSITLPLRTKQVKLDVPLQPKLFAGTNVLPAGIEGGVDDLKGRIKPLCYGYGSNVPAVCVNTSKLIYQVSSEAVSSVTTVYDRGVALPGNGTYTSQADMEANVPLAGYFKVWTSAAGCYFRLNGTPAGTVTADVDAGGSAAQRTAAQVIVDILTVHDLAAVTGNADITALDTANPAEIEFFADADMTVANALDMVCGTVGAYWGYDRLGAFRVRRFDAPSGTPVLTFRSNTSDGLTNLEVAAITFEIFPPADQQGGIPVWMVQGTAAPNWTVQGDTDLAGSVTAARRAFLSKENRPTTSAGVAFTKTKHLLSQIMQVSSLFKAISDGNAECTRINNMRSVRRDRVVIRARLDSVTAQIDLGDVVSVIVPRFGFDAGKLMRITGIVMDGKTRSLSFELWG